MQFNKIVILFHFFVFLKSIKCTTCNEQFINFKCLYKQKHLKNKLNIV